MQAPSYDDLVRKACLRLKIKSNFGLISQGNNMFLRNKMQFFSTLAAQGKIRYYF
jgi:hypothetical protein